MHSPEVLLEMHREAQVIKEHWWYQHHEPDPPPMLALRYRDMEPQAVDFQEVGESVRKVLRWTRIMRNRPADDEPRVPAVIYIALRAASEGVALPGMKTAVPVGTPLESVQFAVEGYAIESETDDRGELLHPEEYPSTSLEQDYKTNPASKVLERLTTYVVETSSTGLPEWGRVTSAFHKDDGGRIVWHEPLVETSESHNPTIDMIIDAIKPFVTRENLT